MPVSSSLRSMASPKRLADQLGYWISMCLSFKPNVTWFVYVSSTQTSKPHGKNNSWLGALAAGAHSHSTTGTMANPALFTILQDWSLRRNVMCCPINFTLFGQ